MQNKKVQYKMENNEFLKIRIQNRMCYYFDNIMILDYFDLDILIDKISNENILIYDTSHKTLIDSKPLRIMFNKNEWIY